ncbi:MAG: hypothetical protein UT02_C0056G0003 [Parcubacteria group bacterium GW2011_GWC2_38_7]|nr:MAG: hypothetical protein UT02_C0056G0003 [Parcubacteria group bacterium GW2011_GWC2_38_7]
MSKKCLACGAPLDGFFAKIANLAGVKPSNKNPDYCNKCEAQIPSAPSAPVEKPAEPKDLYESATEPLRQPQNHQNQSNQKFNLIKKNLKTCLLIQIKRYKDCAVMNKNLCSLRRFIFIVISDKISSNLTYGRINSNAQTISSD